MLTLKPPPTATSWGVAHSRLRRRMRCFGMVAVSLALMECSSAEIRPQQPEAEPLAEQSEAIWGEVDEYGGMLGVPCASGAKEHFYAEKSGDRWHLCTPDGNAFFMSGVWNITGEGRKDELGDSYNSRTVQKYGSTENTYVQIARRLKSWGFNTAGPYSYRMALPTDPAQTEKLAFTATAGSYSASCIVQGKTKNLYQGLDQNLFGRYGMFADVFDPQHEPCVAAGYEGSYELRTWAESPYFIGGFSDDGDYLSGFGPGSDFQTTPAGNWHWHLGVLSLVTSPSQTVNPHSNPPNQSYADPKVYAKYALRDWLESKYGSISVLNANWGSSYTTFDSDGGWPNGNGLLDENGRTAHAWLGTAGFQWTLAGMNAQVKADLDEFLYEFAKRYFVAHRDGFKVVAPNALFFGPTNIGGWGAPGRGPILKAAGEYLDVVPLGGGSIARKQEQVDFMAQWAGDKPLVSWVGVISNPDSGRWRYQGVIPTYATQEERGEAYRRDVDAMLNARATSTGSMPFVGLLFWEWHDNFGEQTNWGLVSLLDNAYDGNEARTAPGGDPWGYPTGGEERDYGDFLSTVTAANSSIYGEPAAPRATTSTSLSASASSISVGGSVVFTASVVAVGATPTGSVSFLDGSTLLGSAILTGGTAIFNASTLTVGSHSIKAVYSGDSNCAGGASTAVSVVVSGEELPSTGKLQTTTSLSSSGNPSTAGQAVTFTASVTAAGGSPTGSVQFLDGSTPLGSAVLSSGTAVFGTSSLAAGAHSISAVYGGDADFAGSMSIALPQTVSTLATPTLTSSLNPSVEGQAVVFTAGLGVPCAGTVEFMDGDTVIGSSKTNQSGQASLVTSALNAGLHPVSFVVARTANCTVGKPPVLAQAVNPSEDAPPPGHTNPRRSDPKGRFALGDVGVRR